LGDKRGKVVVCIVLACQKQYNTLVVNKLQIQNSKESCQIITKKNNSTEVIINNQNATSFAGLTVAREMMLKLSMWRQIMNDLPKKASGHKRSSIVTGALLGFLSGNSGIQLLEGIRNDQALCNHFEISSLPTPKNFREELAKEAPRFLISLIKFCE
jgi:hypothetical protein